MRNQWLPRRGGKRLGRDDNNTHLIAKTWLFRCDGQSPFFFLFCNGQVNHTHNVPQITFEVKIDVFFNYGVVFTHTDQQEIIYYTISDVLTMDRGYTFVDEL